MEPLRTPRAVQGTKETSGREGGVLPLYSVGLLAAPFKAPSNERHGPGHLAFTDLQVAQCGWL